MNQDSQPQWFYAHDGQAFGPLSFDELRNLLNTGTITPDTMIVHEGSEDWQPFAHYLTAPAETASGAREETGHSETAQESEGKPVSRRARAAYDAEQSHQHAMRKGCRGCLILFVAAVGITMLLVRCMTGEVELSDDELNNPEVGVRKLMRAVYGSRLREVEAHRITAGDVGLGRLNVYVRVNTGNDSKRGMDFKMIDAYKALYTSGLPIWEATIWNFEKLVDPYGKESDEIVYKTTLHSREASKINWKNEANVRFERLWKVNYLHPVLQKP